MSVFEEQSSFLEQLVKEQGEQWKEPEAIAKGYVKSQEHIANLERQVNELKEDLTKASTVDELMSKLKEQAPTGTGTPPEGTGSPPEVTPQFGEEEIKALITESLMQNAKNQTASQNLAETDALLAKAFGTEAQKVFNERAVELGMSKEQLQQIAEQSPQALMRLVGEPKKTETNQTVAGSVNTETETFTSNDEDLRGYYTEMRRKNPNLYYSPKTQQDIMRAVAEGKYKI